MQWFFFVVSTPLSELTTLISSELIQDPIGGRPFCLSQISLPVALPMQSWRVVVLSPPLLVSSSIDGAVVSSYR